MLINNIQSSLGIPAMANDNDSIFSYDGEGESDSFSLSLLTAAVTDTLALEAGCEYLYQGAAISKYCDNRLTGLHF